MILYLPLLSRRLLLLFLSCKISEASLQLQTVSLRKTPVSSSERIDPALRAAKLAAEIARPAALNPVAAVISERVDPSLRAAKLAAEIARPVSLKPIQASHLIHFSCYSGWICFAHV